MVANAARLIGRGEQLTKSNDGANHLRRTALLPEPSPVAPACPTVLKRLQQQGIAHRTSRNTYVIADISAKAKGPSPRPLTRATPWNSSGAVLKSLRQLADRA